MEELGQRPTDNHLLGAASEHVVSAYYLSGGHLVYWPAYPNGTFDLLVDIDGEFKKVQVKTAYWSGGFLRVSPRLNGYDTLVVVHEDDLWEIPASEIDASTIQLRSNNPGYESRWERYRT